MFSDCCDIGVDNGVIIVGASKSSRDRIVNTIGTIKRHLNSIKNIRRNDKKNAGVESTWRTSPLKSTYRDSSQNAASASASASSSLSSPSLLDKGLNRKVSFVSSRSPDYPLFDMTLTEHSSDSHDKALPASSSMDVEVLGLSLVVEDIFSMMHRMTLYVDPSCGNLLRFSSDQPMLGSSLLTLHNCNNKSAYDITVACHSMSHVSSLMSACDKEDIRLSNLIKKGEIDGVVCLQTDVEEILHSRTIRASVNAKLPIVTVGLASAQQIMQLGGHVISCYDLSLAPLAASSISMSPFLPPNILSKPNDSPSEQSFMTASYSYHLKAEQLCDESLGFYVASSFAYFWREEKKYSIPQPRHARVLDNIVRRSYLLFGYIIFFYWILDSLRYVLYPMGHKASSELSLAGLFHPSSVITQPYMYFSMIVFSYTCLHFAHPIEDVASSRRWHMNVVPQRYRKYRVFGYLSRHIKWVLYKHSRKYMIRLAATAFLFLHLMNYSLLPSPHQSPIEVNTICSKYALTLGYMLGTICGTMQFYTNLLLNKFSNNSFKTSCDVLSIALSFLGTGILVVLLSRGYNLNYRGDFASDFSNRYACEDLNSLQWGLNISNYSENRYPMELNSFWFLPPPVGRFLCTVSVAGVHLMYLCMSQFMSVLGVVSKSLHSDLCKLNSYFWRIAAGHHDLFSSVPMPYVVVPTIIFSFSFFVSCISIMFIETKRLYLLVIPAVLLDMDELMSPLEVSIHNVIFWRTRYIIALYMPYAGVIGAIAIRSIIRTETLFLYYRYLDEYLNESLKKSNVDELIVKRKKSLLQVLRSALFQCSKPFISYFGFMELIPRNSDTLEGIVIDLGYNIELDKEIEHDNLGDSVDNGDVHRLRVCIEPELLGRVIRNYFVTSDNISRIFRMAYDWIYMRDCLLELKLCSQQHTVWVKLFGLRLLPFLVATRIIVVNSTNQDFEASRFYDGIFPLLHDGYEWFSPFMLMIFRTISTLLTPAGSFLTACLFSLTILCAPKFS